MDFATVCLDPGHGGNSRGVNMGHIDEARWTLDMSSRVLQIASGHPGPLNVVRTRAEDSYLSLWQRGQIAANAGSELAISIHVNGQDLAIRNGDDSVIGEIPVGERLHGCLVFYIAGDQMSLDVAQAIAESMPTQFLNGSKKNPLVPVPVGLTNKDWRMRVYQVLRNFSCPSVLLECGYASHPEDLRLLHDLKMQWSIARAVQDGITRFMLLSGALDGKRSVIPDEERVKEIDSRATTEEIERYGRLEEVKRDRED